MVDFKSLLNKSLSAVAEGYKTASGDLESIVQGVDDAIKELAGEKFGLSLGSPKSDIKGSIFRVYFDTNIEHEQAETITIQFFNIPAGGYPIRLGSFHYKNSLFIAEKALDDRTALESFFVDLLNNPESSLLQAVAYAVRTNPEDFDDDPF